MKKNQAAMAITVCVLALGTWGATSVRAMVNTYSGVCGSLDGVPGLLQKAGFVPRGNCKAIVPIGPDHKCRASACEVAGKAGHCLQVGDGKKYYCACRVDRTSR